MLLELRTSIDQKMMSRDKLHYIITKRGHPYRWNAYVEIDITYFKRKLVTIPIFRLSALPHFSDGRTQVVTYSVTDPQSGYIADVKYEGVASYPKAPPPKPAYKPAPHPTAWNWQAPYYILIKMN